MHTPAKQKICWFCCLFFTADDRSILVLYCFNFIRLSINSKVINNIYNINNTYVALETFYVTIKFFSLYILHTCVQNIFCPDGSKAPQPLACCWWEERIGRAKGRQLNCWDKEFNRKSKNHTHKQSKTRNSLTTAHGQAGVSAIPRKAGLHHS